MIAARARCNRPYRLVLALIPLFFAANAAVSAPITGKVIFVQQAFAPSCDDCGILIQGLIQFEDRARAREMARINEEITTALSGTSLSNLLHPSFCKAIFALDGQCDRVVLLGPGDNNGNVPELKVEPNDIIVRLAVEFVRNEFRVIGAVSTVEDGKIKSAALYAWYRAPPAAGLQAAPFDPVSNRNAASVAAAKEYWLTGNPSVLATELALSFDEVGAIISASTVALDPESGGFRAWWKELPTIKSLVEEGRVACKGFVCSLRYLKVTPDRIWHAQMADGVVIVSLPVTALDR
jgi:hypothetical protein